MPTLNNIWLKIIINKNKQQNALSIIDHLSECYRKQCENLQPHSEQSTFRRIDWQGNDDFSQILREQCQ